MKITFRIIMIGVAVVGLGLGVSFGAGIAYGRSTPKAAASVPTQQQLNQQLGVTGSSGAGAGSGAAATAVAGRAGGSTGAGAGLLGARNTAGKIKAIEGRTVTVETRGGDVKVTLAANATIEKVSNGATSDLKVGDTVIATGNRNSDGSVDASAISQVPSELQALVNAAAGGGTTGASATPTGR